MKGTQEPATHPTSNKLNDNWQLKHFFLLIPTEGKLFLPRSRLITGYVTQSNLVMSPCNHMTLVLIRVKSKF